jgi:hypothetical protein
MHRRIVITLLSGVLAGFLPLLPGVGLLFGAWAPFLPLLFLGLSEGARAAVHAGCIAVIVSLGLGGEQAAFNMAVFVALPVCVLLNRLLCYRTNASGQVEWFPALRAVTELSVFSAGLFMALAMLASYGQKQNLQALLSASFALDLSTLEPDAEALMRKLIGEWSFFLFAAVGWMWVLVTWLLALMVNRMLVIRASALRTDISLAPRGIPRWLPALLTLCAGLALLGQGNDGFVGKVVFLILLLPYFLSGMAMIHAMSRLWRPRVLWLFLIYIILIFQVWTAIFVAAAGLYFHLSEILDKQRKIG